MGPLSLDSFHPFNVSNCCQPKSQCQLGQSATVRQVPTIFRHLQGRLLRPVNDGVMVGRCMERQVLSLGVMHSGEKRSQLDILINIPRFALKVSTARSSWRPLLCARSRVCAPQWRLHSAVSVTATQLQASSHPTGERAYSRRDTLRYAVSDSLAERAGTCRTKLSARGHSFNPLEQSGRAGTERVYGETERTDDPTL